MEDVLHESHQRAALERTGTGRRRCGVFVLPPKRPTGHQGPERRVGTSISTDRAFTLIELLIVMAITAVLASMLSVMMLIAQRQGKITNTKALMMQVDQAIRLFRTDMKVYPWQTDLGAPPAEPATWSNNLAWRLAWSPPEPGKGTASNPDRFTYIKNFQEDLTAIQRAFRFVDGKNVPPRGSASEGTHAFRNEEQSNSSWTNLMLRGGTLRAPTASISSWSATQVPGTSAFGPDCAGDAKALTKMAEEYVRMAYVSGQMPVVAPSGIDAALPADKALHPLEDERHVSISNVFGSGFPFRYVPYNKVGVNGDDSRGPVLTSATAKAMGWRADYLAGALRTPADDGTRMDVDASGNAIVDAWGHPLIYVCQVRCGVRGGLSPLPTSMVSVVRQERYNMEPQGRLPTELLLSDIRSTAGQEFALEYELWSAGPDGMFAATRSDPVNRDNIALVRYDRGLR
jgi:prepilin-type N-terminal cleavage/methylation domain-containing protein